MDIVKCLFLFIVVKYGPSCSKRRYLNELVKGHFVNCFSGFNIQYSDIFAEKKFAKATHIFSEKIQHICVSLDVNFNESLTNDIVCFEQLGPGEQFRTEICYTNGRNISVKIL